MDSLVEIAKVLRAARMLSGLRQDELAVRAHISRQMVARIENAGKGIPFDAVENVKAALEEAGVDFFPSTMSHGVSIALRRLEKGE
jgi:transcriptional regulator with XRE-family HTH domain